MITPSRKVEGYDSDVWSIINEAASKCPIKPVVNLGQGFFGYNPPSFVLEAAKSVIDRTDCNQYSPPSGRDRLKNALSKTYSPLFKRNLNPANEIVVTTGANEGILCAILAFVEPGDEVILFEPFFDQYTMNVKLAQGKAVYVPILPPCSGSTAVSSAAEWKFDINAFKACITPKTKMVILNNPHNPIGKIFSREELQAIGDTCVKNNVIILSDEVYDRLDYTPLHRMATLSPDIWNITLTVGSGGKTFYATGWRVGWVIGPHNLIKCVTIAHRMVCYCGVSPMQEAMAISIEEAEKNNFWQTSRQEMHEKMLFFNKIWDELAIPYSIPDGGYFVLANFSRLKLPSDYNFPDHVKTKSRDYKIAWFLIMEFGLACIPTTDFVSPEHAPVMENWLRFAVCKPNSVLEMAHERLRLVAKLF